MVRNEIIRAVAQRVHDLGGQALLVGGCVRDGLLGMDSHDVDCEVHGVEPQALRTLLAGLGGIDLSGEAYGVYALRDAHVDIALPRRERRTGPSHRDFEIEINPQLSPAQAAARRDFTVNAIMRDALTGEYIDPYGGMDDLRCGVLRAVPGGQFEEDPLRVLRGAQFAARFHLTPDEDTLEHMRRMPLQSLSAARVLAEMKKAVLLSDQPDVFFRVLAQAGALDPWFAELHALQGIMQNPVYHPEGDALEHTMRVVREAAAFRAQARDPLAFMLAALAHDLGKAVSTRKNEKGDWQSIGHEHTGVPLAGSLLSRLGVSAGTIAYAQNMCALHMRVHTCYYQKARISRTNILFDEAQSPRELAWLVLCDARGTGKPRAGADEEERFVLERLAVYEQAAAQPMPDAEKLMDAGVSPGPQLGRAIREARRRVLCGETAGCAVRHAAQCVHTLQEQRDGQNQ